MSLKHSPKEEMLQNFTGLGQYSADFFWKDRIIFQRHKIQSWLVNREVRISSVFLPSYADFNSEVGCTV